ncbi:DNA starvation/stationary phase protection protein [Embleya sp. NBC_00888]|uniref:Dps family protein n=1 Tax=Embleya sp. NBC_00888 TaxID=2975960 RepID=UPI003870DE4E|nr:DNA starvation/stationary phase protection protein [Embleya sp. NBC_00888]
MVVVKSPLSDDARKITGEALQGALVDLIDLSLVAKQTHWNVVGPRFRSIHLQLDEVVASARAFADTVAERASAIGYNPDGRAATITAGSGVPQPDSGWIKDADVVAYFVGVYGAVIERMRERIAATEEPDPVSQDLFITIAADLEKMSWMFQAENQA